MFVPPPGARVIAELGAGSVFEVALVETRVGEALCKRLRSRMLAEPRAQAAMAREIELLSRLRIGAAPRLVDHGADDRGPWSLQQRVVALSARQLVEAWAERGRPPPRGVIDSLLVASLWALSEIHRAPGANAEPDGVGRAGPGALEVVHGDIGPDHVLLRRDGSACFVDFGLARWRGADEALYGEGERGTVPFVAPEVARGERAPDHESDLYALAATVAFVALGRDPCRRQGAAARLAEAAEQGADRQAVAGAKLSAAARRVLLAALAFDRAERPKDARQALFLFDPAAERITSRSR